MPKLSTKRSAAQRKGNLAKTLPAEGWTGPVVRRDPASYQRRSEHLTWMCKNAHCRQWTMNGAYQRGRCNFCETPR